MEKTELINFRVPTDIAAALKHAAADALRSVNQQGVLYIRAGLVGDGYYQPGNGAVPARPTAVPPPVAIPATGHGTQLPAAPAPITELQAIGVLTTINAEFRLEGRPKLTGHNYKLMTRLLAEAFPDVRDLASARAKGPSQWLNAGALPGLIRALFPDNLGAAAMAKKSQNASHMKRKIERGSEVRKFITAKGIVRKGAVAAAYSGR